MFKKEKRKKERKRGWKGKGRKMKEKGKSFWASVFRYRKMTSYKLRYS